MASFHFLTIFLNIMKEEASNGNYWPMIIVGILITTITLAIIVNLHNWIILFKAGKNAATSIKDKLEDINNKKENKKK